MRGRGKPVPTQFKRKGLTIYASPFWVSVILTYLWYFDHRSQAARADVDVTRSAVDLDTATMHVQHEAATRAVLRMGYVVAIHRLALANVTTTCWHVFSSRKISTACHTSCIRRMVIRSALTWFSSGPLIYCTVKSHTDRDPNTLWEYTLFRVIWQAR